MGGAKFMRKMNFKFISYRLFSYAFVIILLPIHLFVQIIQILNNIKYLRSTDLIIVAPGLGFGHSITGIDIMRRFYYNMNTIFIMIGWGYHNPYVTSLWGKTKVIYLKSYINTRMVNSRYFVLVNKIILNIIYNVIIYFIKWVSKTKVLELKDMYQASLTSVKKGFNAINRYMDEYPLNYGFQVIPWYYLIKEIKARRAQLPKDYKNKILAEIVSFTEKSELHTINSFCCIYIRAKGVNTKNISSKMRDGGSIETYLPSIRRIIKAGYIIFIIGDIEIDQKYIKEFNYRVVSSEFLKIDKELFILFAATEANIFIGNYGGGATVPIVNEIPTLIVNALPFGIGSANAQLLFKTVRYKNGALVDYLKLFNDHPYDYTLDSYNIDNNSAEEIDLAVKYFLADLKHANFNSKEDDIIKILPDDLLIKHINSKISKAWLNLNI